MEAGQVHFRNSAGLGLRLKFVFITQHYNAPEELAIKL
jgi:hypothetical protein